MRKGIDFYIRWGFIIFKYYKGNMKKHIITILAVTLFGCGQQTEKSTEQSKSAIDSLSNKEQKYTIEKYNENEDETTDSTFSVGKETFKLTVKNYTKGEHFIADTSDNVITLYKEELIDVVINDKTVTIDKSMFSNLYDANTLYHSGFGTATIDKIDKKNRKVLFKVFCGYHNSDAGEMLNFAVSFDGKYEFINIDPLEGEQ